VRSPCRSSLRRGLPAFETVVEAYKLKTGHGVNLLIILQTQLFSKQLLAAAGSGENVVYTTILANVGLVLRRRFCHPAEEGRPRFRGSRQDNPVQQ
jgi:hypothetical protein